MTSRVWVPASLLLFVPLAAFATPTLTTSSGSTNYVKGSVPVVVDASLTLTDSVGPNLDGARVSISSGLASGEDRLSFTAQGGVSGSYDSNTGILNLSGSASAATYQSVLRSVTYQDIQATNPTTGSRQITFSVGATSLYFPGTGHYYEFVADLGVTWTDAAAAADSRTYFGLQGYLVTVTSAAENAFIQSKLEGEGWMGAHTPLLTVPRDWSWVTGPESGKQFFHQEDTSGNGYPLNSMYNNWDSGEPNNDYGSPPAEDCAHFHADGTWNDYPDDNGLAISGYVTEYGGMPGDPALQLSGSKTVQVTTSASASAIPTLTEWGMWMFAGIMAISASWLLRKQPRFGGV